MTAIAEDIIHPVNVPRHVGFILDGNRRWARTKGIPTYDGHLAGYNALKEVTTEVFESGIEYMSVYLFSTENWKRDKKEISGIMKLALRIITSDLKLLIRNKIRVRFAGHREGIGGRMLTAIERAEDATRSFEGRTLLLCFNYGGHQEIVDAVRACIQQGYEPDDVTPQIIEEHLYAPDVPPVDMVVRTSGEQRLSNFMLWRAAYSELLFLEKYWPDMTKEDVAGIIDEYSNRSRRYGG